jgi:hypothetical protein
MESSGCPIHQAVSGKSEDRRRSVPCLKREVCGIPTEPQACVATSGCVSQHENAAAFSAIATIVKNRCDARASVRLRPQSAGEFAGLGGALAARAVCGNPRVSRLPAGFPTISADVWALNAASLNRTPEVQFQRAIFCHWQEFWSANVYI